jgi:hypothetical protein
VARSSAGRPKAGKPDPDASSLDPTDPSEDAAELEEVELEEPDPEEAAPDPEANADDEGEISRTRQTDEFWAKVKIDPVEIALPGGVGYTLRTYRMNTEVKPTDYAAREEDEFPDRTSAYAADEDDDDFIDDDLDEDEDEDALDDETDDDDLSAEDLSDEDLDDKEEIEEEVPLFLSQNGQLLLFHSRAGLVAFVRSGAEHDLAQLKGWSKFANQLRSEQVVPLPEDSYELDLVVKNLRSGHDTWDPELIVQSGQIARDIGHALHIEPIVMAMAPGSPLDDLDDALRAVAEGGVGTFFARRKAKKIGSETAAIGWRTVIGKISAVVDWRD